MSGKIAIVTGAGSGIGRATAVALAEAGYGVVLAGRRPEALAETAAMGRGMVHIPTDVTDTLAVVALFDQTVARFGRVDLLFNNAGCSAPALALEDMPVDVLRGVLDVNLWGAVLCAREAMRVMKAQTPQGGRIINNGSLSAYVPRPLSTAYVVSKHAITGLTRSLLLDGRGFDIACSQIDIGNAVTDMSDHMVAGALQADGEMRTEPRMDVQHVADMVVHMAGLPLEANIPFVTVMASSMPFYGRG